MKIKKIIGKMPPSCVQRGMVTSAMCVFFSVGCVTFSLQASASSENVSNISNSTDYIEVSSPTEISDIFVEDGSMLTDQEAESDSAYATKRIILMGVDADGKIVRGNSSAASDNTVPDYNKGESLTDFGASSIISYPEYDEMILSFDTEAATKAAYEKLLAIYGEEYCFLDEVIHSDEVLFEGDTSDTSEETETFIEKYTATSWGVSAMGMDQLKSSYTADYSNDVTVAVLDTGVNAENTMFSGRRIAGYNVMTNSDDYSDIVTSKDGHGTHVCGIIADATPSNVDLLVIGVFNAKGSSTHLAVSLAFQYALEHGADVINMSAGYRSTTLTFLDSIIDTAYKAGVPVVTATGNALGDVANVYPASNVQTVAVSGLKQQAGADYGLAFDSSYSNYGTLTDFSAPGTNIVSAANTSGTAYATKKGTSMSSPHIAAAFAWLKLFYPAEPTSELYAHLVKYCVDLGDTGRDIFYGNGCPILSDLLKDAGYKPSGDTTEATTESTETTETTETTESTETTETTETTESTETTEVTEATTETTETTEATEATTETTEVTEATTETKAATTEATGQTKTTTEATTEKSTSSKTNQKSSAVSKPKSTKITFARRKCLRAIRLRWKKVSGVSGYQICYSTSKNFRKNNHYLTLKGASKNYRLIRRLQRHRTFYVRVRTYKTVKGKRVFSNWSNVKKVKTI